MVGMIDPNPETPNEPPHQDDQARWWDRYAPITIRRPAQGHQSPKTDEVCMTFCSQTARGRAEGQDPWCRSICIRRVFAHEVNSVLSHSNQNKPSGSQSSQFPLPPEGQPSSAIIDGVIGGPNQDCRPSATDVRYWQEGFYVWFTKNRWAAQERVDLMMMDLARQTDWIREKEYNERVWFNSQMQRVRTVVQAGNEVTEEGDDLQQQEPGSGSNDWYQDPPPPIRHPYPDAAKESVLLKAPSNITTPLTNYTNKIILPTRHLLDFVQESMNSGKQQQFAQRAWDTVKSGAPLVLARNVAATVVQALSEGDGPDKK